MQRHEGGGIILLNGTSSAGKTTLARALQPGLGEPFCYYASDQLADAGFRSRSPPERRRLRGIASLMDSIARLRRSPRRETT